jgi:hypothetical protein
MKCHITIYVWHSRSCCVDLAQTPGPRASCVERRGVSAALRAFESFLFLALALMFFQRRDCCRQRHAGIDHLIVQQHACFAASLDDGTGIGGLRGSLQARSAAGSLI